ncbi:MAG TPA: hypothetical protein ENG51_00855, partial [Deltaproteobacteria bacterium]|nr:hypothetical protein [Deltaproteobacteria bacterium]
MLGDVSYLFDRIREDEIRQAMEGVGVNTSVDVIKDTPETTVMAVKDEKFFVYLIATKPVKLPIWKVVAPEVNNGWIGKDGANYYIIHSD